MTATKSNLPKASTETFYRLLAGVPWWMVIILIVGAITGYSVLTRTAYQDVLRFLFGLPWHKELVAEAVQGEDGSWKFESSSLDPGSYRLYGEFLDEAGDPVGRTEVYRLQVPKEAEEVLVQPLLLPPATAVEEKIDELVQEATTTSDARVARIQFYNRFTFLGTLSKMWGSNGVFLTIKITLSAFSTALVIGLFFGLGRVASKNPDLSLGLGRRLLYGLVIAVALIALQWFIKGSAGEAGGLQASTVFLTLLGVEVILFLLPALPYTVSAIYVEVVRGIPLLVIILYMGYVVTPQLRDLTDGELNLQGLPAAVIGLAFGYGAYLAEVYRAGIESIHRGQMEAARSLGMSYFQAMRYIVLPQAIRRILPPLGNDFIAMLKDSSLIAVIALPDMLQMGRLHISRTFRAFEGYNTVALMYLVMTFFLSLVVRMVERRMAIVE
jgi:His/Glu/Gln/Arg/opine family amino acid ABC transporter permease subunit